MRRLFLGTGYVAAVCAGVVTSAQLWMHALDAREPFPSHSVALPPAHERVMAALVVPTAVTRKPPLAPGPNFFLAITPLTTTGFGPSAAARSVPTPAAGATTPEGPPQGPQPSPAVGAGEPTVSPPGPGQSASVAPVQIPPATSQQTRPRPRASVHSHGHAVRAVRATPARPPATVPALPATPAVPPAHAEKAERRQSKPAKADKPQKPSTPDEVPSQDSQDTGPASPPGHGDDHGAGHGNGHGK